MPVMDWRINLRSTSPLLNKYSSSIDDSDIPNMINNALVIIPVLSFPDKQ